MGGKKRLPPGSAWVHCDSGDDKVQKFTHSVTSIVFHLVPEFDFVRGLSEDEERALRAAFAGADDEEACESFLDGASLMRPTQTVHVPSFLLAAEPLSAEQLALLLTPELIDSGILPGCLGAAAADVAIAELGVHGWRLPSETEWEHAYRAGTSAPFPWGTKRPDSPWSPSNTYGFEGMGEYSELCADGWQPSYEGAPIDGSARSGGARVRVTRGGSGAYWPWQGVGEWLTMLAANRSPASDHEGCLTIRPACDAPKSML